MKHIYGYSKGQAFDTFKLMIAAVVAVAILGILMGILSQITVPGADPVNMMNDQLTKAHQYPGTIVISSASAAFQKGMVYSGASFIQVLGGTGKVVFVCDDVYTGTPKSNTDPCYVNPTATTAVAINGAFSAKIRACCNSASTPACVVGVGANAVMKDAVVPGTATKICP